MAPLCFAYYCSGHGYGHATRVSAFACHLRSLGQPEQPTIHIVSSAPKHVFADSIALGVHYRYAEIDPVIVQPLAYRVDRQKSIDVLKSFLGRKDAILEEERRWLIDVNADCVLSDAAFLGCLAAKSAGIPSILITNFTFDSVYSYLSTLLLDAPSPQTVALHPTSPKFEDLIPDIPVPSSELSPLVEQIHLGYRCADLLLLLPGFIPVPSFSIEPPLPSSDWVNPHSNKLNPKVIAHLTQSPATYNIHPSLPKLKSRPYHTLPRAIIPAPLIVRPVSSFVYTPAGRAHFLSSIGVPSHLHDPSHTKILVVSFGGQVFRRPSKSSSASCSRSVSPEPQSIHSSPQKQILPSLSRSHVNGLGISNLSSTQVDGSALNGSTANGSTPDIDPPSQILSTQSHIWIPGAPPVSIPLPSPSITQTASNSIPTLTMIPPTPTPQSEVAYFNLKQFEAESSEVPRLLPDSSWIAIVCGVSKEQWEDQGEGGDSELPDGFFVAPRDVYMPNLTAVANVLLGKLGYGTVSECVDSRTPFVYVPRPLFIEEHGLRLLLERDGVGIELSRHLYEAGDWASAVEEAWKKGGDAKSEKRHEAGMGIGLQSRIDEGRQMAHDVVQWVKDWWG